MGSTRYDTQEFIKVKEYCIEILPAKYSKARIVLPDKTVEVCLDGINWIRMPDAADEYDIMIGFEAGVAYMRGHGK